MAKLLSNTRIYGTATVDTRLFINGELGVHSTNSGVLQTLGGVGVWGGIFASGVVTATSFVGNITGTASTATTSTQANNLNGGTAGQLVYQSAANTTAFAGPGTAGQILVSAGTGAPTYTNTSSIYVNRAVTADTTPAATAATNLSGGLLGQIPYQLAAGSTAFIGTGTAGTILQMGANTATFVATSTIYVNRAVLADNDVGGAAGGLRYQTGANASTFLSIGTAGQVLTVNSGATAPQWTTTGSIYAGAATSAVNVFGGAGGSLHYQSAANTTAMLSIGSANSILVSNGSVPSWTTSPTIGGNVTIVGNLTVQGTTVIVDSTVTNVSDPIFKIGTGPNGALPSSDDGKDRGIAFDWHNGTTGRTGFFGFDRSTGYFTFISSASIVNEVVSPAGGTTRGALDVNLAGGTAGQLVYQSAADTTAFAGPGTAGQLLVSAGTSAPTYTNTSSIYVNSAVNAEKVNTVLQTANANYFPVFVDANNSSAALENLHTTSTFIINPSTGRVGIRNTAPANLLHVGNTTTNYVTIQATAGTQPSLYLEHPIGYTELYNSYGTIGLLAYLNGEGKSLNSQVLYFAGYNNTADASLQLFDGKVHIAGNGNVGIANTSPTAKLDITGGVRISGVTTVTNTISVHSTITGALQVAGGLGVGGGGFFGAVVTATTFVGALTGTASAATNIAGGTAGQVAYQTGAGATSFYGPGTAGQILVSAGTSAPTYTNTSSIYVNRAVLADNDAGGAAGGLRYQTAANASTFLSIGTAGQMLRVNSGATAPEWVGTASIYVNRAVLADSATGNAGSATNLAGGTAGQVPYQTGAGATSFFGPGTAGQILVSAGTSAPTYTNTASIYVNRAVTADSVANALTFSDAGTGAATGSTFNGSTARTISYNSVGASQAGQNLDSTNAKQPNSFISSDTRSTNFTPGGRVAGLYADFKTNTTDGLVDGGTYHGVLTFRSYGTSNTDFSGGQAQQIAYTDNNNLWHRISTNSSTWGTWYKIIDTNNTATAYVNNAVVAETVNTVARPNGGFHYLTFADSHNASSTAELMYTTSTLLLSPATGILTATSISITNSLGVGTVPSGTAGEIRATNEITAYYSDRRLKDNVKIIDNPIDKILSLHGITYTPNAVAAKFGYDQGKKLVGVFADEVEAVLPEAVRPAPFDTDTNGASISGDNYKTVQYEKLVPLLIEAVKAQQKLIEKLENDLQTLKQALK